MTTTKQYTLAAIFTELCRQSRRTGLDARADLRGGARLAVRIQDREITLTVARREKRLGDAELVTFHRTCQVPRHAIRWPAEGQHNRRDEGATWWLVAWRWIEERKHPDAG